MVKRNLIKGLALFIVLTFVMSLAPAVCLAEGENASNIVFQIWQDTALSSIDASDTDYKALFAGKVKQEGGIKFINNANGSAKDGTNAAAILHGNYNSNTDTPSLTRKYYVDFGADISSLVMANGYDKTFVSF